jgi:predicted nucleic acid binding AN1-type Zn finger protein
VILFIKMKKNTCFVETCGERVVKIIGDCRYCNEKFCSKHRLPEAHVCSHLDSCREQASNKLTAKLMNEKTLGQKV